MTQRARMRPPIAVPTAGDLFKPKLVTALRES
jgi:hypothetical protein